MVSTRCFAFVVSWYLVSGRDECDTSGSCFEEAQEIGPSLLSKRSLNDKFFSLDDIRKVKSCSFIGQNVDTITGELSNLRRTPEELKEKATNKANQAVQEIITEYQKTLANLKSLKQLFVPSSSQGQEDAAENDIDNYLLPAGNNETEEVMTVESIFGDNDDDPEIDDMPFLLQTDGKESINKDEIIEVATAVIFEQISPYAKQFFAYLEKQLDKATEKVRKLVTNVGQKTLDLINEAEAVLEYPGVSQETKKKFGPAFLDCAEKTKKVMNAYDTFKTTLVDKAKVLFAQHFPQHSDVLSLEQKKNTDMGPSLEDFGNLALNLACQMTDIKNALKNAFEKIYAPLSSITQKKNEIIRFLEANVDEVRKSYMEYLTRVARGIKLVENAVKNDLLR